MLFENGISDAPSSVDVADAADDRTGLTKSSAVAAGAARETGWQQKLQEQDSWRRAASRSWQVMDGCASYGEAKDPRRSARLVDDDAICCMSMEPPLQEQHAGPRPTSRSHEAYRIAKRPRPAVLAAWGRRIASPIVACWSWFRREREIRAAIAAWESLDDWMLRDIGVPRGRIEHIVRHGEYR